MSLAVSGADAPPKADDVLWQRLKRVEELERETLNSALASLGGADQ